MRLKFFAAPEEGTTPTSTPAGQTGTTQAPPAGQQTQQTQQTTATPDEGGILDGTTAPGKTPEKPAEPAKPAQEGEIAVKFPEGVEVDKGLMDEFLPIAKDLGLKSEGAQKLADLFVKAQGRQAEALNSAWSQTQQGWLDAVKKDSDLGGAKYDETVSLVRKTIDKFGGDGLRQAFRDLGIGNHPEIVRFVARIGKAISEDSITGATGSAPKMDDEDARAAEAFPSMRKQ